MLSENVNLPITPKTTRSATKKSGRGRIQQRKASTLRLSSETTPTPLPKYSAAAPGTSKSPRSSWGATAVLDESPPGYYQGSRRTTDSAEEADEETELTSSESEDLKTPCVFKGRQGSLGILPRGTRSATPSPRRSHFTAQVANPPFTPSPRRPKRFPHIQKSDLEDLKDPKTNKRRHSSASLRTHVPRHKQTGSLSSSTSHKSKLNQTQRSRDTDSILDSLLERSVHALEMSNTLLQTSISTQASVSALFSGSSTSLGAFRSAPMSQSPESTASKGGYSAYHDVDSALEARAIGLSSRLMRNWDLQEGWAEQLEKIKDGVDSLFSDDVATQSRSACAIEVAPTAVSRSLPSNSPTTPLRISSPTASSLSGSPKKSIADDMGVSELHASPPQRQPSEGEVNVPPQAQLRLAPQDRSNLVSRPPRALTMYIEATSSPSIANFEGLAVEEDLSTLVLPSTLGVRSASASTTNLLLPSSTVPPQVSATQYDPSTPAYAMLSSLAARSTTNIGASASTSHLLSVPSTRIATPRRTFSDSNPASAPSSFMSTFIHRAAAGITRRESSPSIAKGGRGRRSSSVDRLASPSTRRSLGPRPSNITVPNGNGIGGPAHLPLIRRMTPPTEEGSQTDEEGSATSSDGCVAKMTVMSLRKILDVQQAAPAQQQNGGGQTSGLPPSSSHPGQLSTSTSSPDAAVLPKSSRPSSFLTGDSPKHRVAHRPAPAFMPRTPVPAPSAGTSTATASVSKLFTKGVHSSSTQPRSPLKSVMKGKAPLRPAPVLHLDCGRPEHPTAPSVSGSNRHRRPSLGVAAESLCDSPAGSSLPSPSGSSSYANLPESVSRALASGSRTAPPSSGGSTPKRISFAELPESYGSSRPAGQPYSKRRTGKKRARKSLKGSGNESSGMNVRRTSTNSDEEKSWWSTWLLPSPRAYDREGRDRIMYQEDRTTRAWGGRMGMALGAGGTISHTGMDEWGI